MGFFVGGMNLLTGGLMSDAEADLSGLKFKTVSQIGDEAVVNISGVMVQGLLGAAIEQELNANVVMLKEDGQWKYCGE